MEIPVSPAINRHKLAIHITFVMIKITSPNNAGGCCSIAVSWLLVLDENVCKDYSDEKGKMHVRHNDFKDVWYVEQTQGQRGHMSRVDDGEVHVPKVLFPFLSL